MEQARILRVVVASPGDVQSERDLVSKVVEEVNRNVASDKGLRLEVYRWEADTYPGFHAEGPQGLIDPILKIEDCDILVGIFWKRFGKPVKDAMSGTQHEFNTAYEAWKKKSTPQIMVYFSGKAYTPKSKAETDQWGLVLQFKAEFPEEGLWWSYRNPGDFEGLLRNHLIQFLRAYASPAAEVPPPPLHAIFQLPPPPADFTGRKDELADLRAAIESGGVHISGLQGQGGVGKTALALKLAEEIAPRFPDAQIYLDLKGVSDKPLTPAEAMSHVIRSFHPESKLPEKETDLAPLYLNVLHGKRALLLMDNAKDAAQVKPLVPPQGCALLVTSRHRFILEGLEPKNLDTLPPDDARRLLLAIAKHRMEDQADTIARLCGYLPLYLRLAASAIRHRTDITAKEYAERLKDENQRLKLLKAKKEWYGKDESAEASINLSYALLHPETQQHWRMLAVFPDTFDAPAASSIWEIPNPIRDSNPSRDREGAVHTDPEPTPDRKGLVLSEPNPPPAELLDTLWRFSLLDWNESTQRYRLHDLMRDFARARLTTTEQDAAARCHARHYKDVLAQADALYLKGGESLLLGLALFDLEWTNIQAGQTWAVATMARAPHDPQAAVLCNSFPNAGAYCVALRLYSRERIAWLAAAASAARRLKDRASEGSHLGNLGAAYADLGETRRSIAFFEQRLKIAREIGDRNGEGIALGFLGIAYAQLGETRRSVKFLEQYLAIVREIGNRRGEGIALVNLGIAYADLSETHRAIEFYEQALAIFREIGDRRSEGADLGNLGTAYKDLGETRRAIAFYEQALAIFREIGDRRGEANALWSTSRALDELGQRQQAIAHAEAALQIFEQIEDPNAAQVKRQLEEWKKR